MDTRYCQRCSTQQKLIDWDKPHPCLKCGGSQFDAQPKLHAPSQAWGLTTEDVNFLRVQRIDPEE